MTRRRSGLFAAIALAAALSPGMALAQGRGAGRGGAEAFPHARHEKLFPTCEGCHGGIASGDAATILPDESTCAACHNGTDERAVTWRRPRPGSAVGMLRFTHRSHAAQVDSAGRECATCHNPQRGARMSIGRAAPATCLGCHTHQASAHLAEDNRCAACHVALTTATAVTRERIARFPKPASHDAPDFSQAHAPAGPSAVSCVVCHARETCTRCHVNASTVPAITAIGRDARVASLVAEKSDPVTYPTPRDHGAEAFSWRHGSVATERTARCATCHARQSCTTCHTGTGARATIARMPVPDRGGASGVRLVLRPSSAHLAVPLQPASLVAPAPDSGRRRAPPPATMVRVHVDGFRDAHGTSAASGAMSCAGCHAQRFCSDCHSGEAASRRRFHAANFTMRHAANAYGRDTDCASCHNTQVFCKSCHQQAGLASSGKLNQAWHTAQPLWLVQHGRAARQGLQNCSSCHAQRDCLTCHSTTGWGVNPHGAGFDAARAAAKAPASCLFCHLEVPRGR